MSTVIDEFSVAIGVDLNESALKKVFDKFDNFKDKLKTLAQGTGLGLVLNQVNKISQSIIDATEATSEWAIELQQTAKKSGVSTEVLQKLYALERQAGIEKGTLADQLEAIVEKQKEGYDWGFASEGINLKGTPTQVLERYIDKGMQGDEAYREKLTEKTGIAPEVFKLFKADISKIGDETIIDDKQIKNLVEVNKKFQEMHEKWDTFKKKLLDFSMPLIEKLLDFAVKKLDKVLKKVDEIRSNSELMQKIEKFLTNTITIMTTIAFIAIPVILKAIGIIGSFLMSGLIKPLLTTLGIVMKITKFLTWTTYFTTFGSIAGQTNEKLTTIQKAAKITSNVFRGLIKVIWSCSKAFIKLGWSILTNPLTWIIGGIGLLTAIIIDLVNVATGGEAKILRWLEKITAGIPGVGKFFKWLRENTGGFWKSAKQFWDGLCELVLGIGELIGKVLGNVWDSFKTFCSDSLDYFLNKFEPIKKFMEKLGFEFDKDTNKLKPETIKDINQSVFVQKYMPELLPKPQNMSPMYMTPNKNQEINYEFKNENIFQIGDVDNPEKVARTVGNYMGSATYQQINKASIYNGNVETN